MAAIKRPSFEIGITMAGAISAGAYTAGVIDFLIEALDAWEAAKARKEKDPASEPLCPMHDVSLRVMSGASAGAIVAAILAANIDRKWNPVRDTQSNAGTDVRNPLFESWVNQVDIRPLLGDNDLKTDPQPVSILDATILDGIAEKALNFDGPKVTRNYVAETLRTIFTLTNLTGVPFKYDLRGNTAQGQDMTMHADLMRFAVLKAGNAPAPSPRFDPDSAYEYPLAPVEGPKWSNADWRRFALTSIASGGFPLGLRPREVNRNKSDYKDIPLAVPGEPAPVPINPSWKVQPNERYGFLSVDGGCMDNEPLQHARAELAGGVLERNARSGLGSDAAVLMIDPFVGPDEPGPTVTAKAPLHLALFKLLGAYTQQSRFAADDIELAFREDVYSRYMVAPLRPTPPLKQASYPAADGQWIASGAMGGFGGFFAREFRRHDFLLGRRNCQQFLAEHFTLPADNKLFALWKDDATLAGYYSIPGIKGEPKQLPIIPLVGTLHPRHNVASAEPLPKWPEGECDVEKLSPAIEARLDALYDKYMSGTGFLSHIFGGLAWWFFKSTILKKIKDMVTLALVDQGLLKAQQPAANNWQDMQPGGTG